MPKLSLTKIFAAIVGIIMLLHLREIFGFIGSVFGWFAESLQFMRDFPEGAQAAIAVAMIGVIIVVTLRVFGK